MTKHRGAVKIQASNGRLRLYWNFQGKPHYFYLGLPDSQIARVKAQSIAAIIEGDLITGNFDPSLNKYKSDDRRSDRIPTYTLMEQFTAQRHLDELTLDKYKVLTTRLQAFFKERWASTIDSTDAQQFTLKLLQLMQPITVKDRLFILKACWAWGIEHEIVQENPWLNPIAGLRVPKKERPKPFTQEECRLILQGFRDNPKYSHYADYVEFMLLSGCRPAEAIGLRWRHINADCSVICIRETWVRGKQKGTKTGEIRYPPLPKRLQDLLLRRRGEHWNPDDFVFTGPRGEVLNDNNFCKRQWKPVLELVKVPYRKPYTTRSTLISHWLEAGENPVVVAEFTGHDVATLYKHYAGSIRKRATPPDFLALDPSPPTT